MDIGLDVGLDVGLDAGLDVGLDVWFNVGLYVWLDVGLDVGLDVMQVPITSTSAILWIPELSLENLMYFAVFPQLSLEKSIS